MENGDRCKSRVAGPVIHTRYIPGSGVLRKILSIPVPGQVPQRIFFVHIYLYKKYINNIVPAENV